MSSYEPDVESSLIFRGPPNQRTIKDLRLFERTGRAMAKSSHPSAKTLLYAVLALGVTSIAAADPPTWIAMNQGPTWMPDTCADFYTRDQGSRLMPLRWIAALKQANGAPFLADSLTRYGYLPNENSSPPRSQR
jgi:hypothetical protein